MDLQRKVEGHARDFGLDFFDTVFEILDYKRMNEVAAFGGFPVRYPHWRFGMDYERLIKSHTYGLSLIYEMVINNDPCYAYLLEGNSLVDQKLVMCHVLGHNDFFKNNYFFSVTNRKMIDEMANHATHLRRYAERHGVDTVEQFVDLCLSLENLVDPMGQYIRRRAPRDEAHPLEPQPEAATSEVSRLAAKPYMERYINPPDFIESQQKRRTDEQEKQQRFPVDPERDVYGFVMAHAPLAPWQRSVMEMIQEESDYYIPQKMTKIMNEGWATYWHSRLMTERVVEAAELVDYARVTAGVTASPPGRFNPYKMGLELFRHIEDRWNKGRFGKDWEDCDRLEDKLSWNRHANQGLAKIFEVRRVYNDATFVNEFFTEDFCREHLYYTFGWSNRKDQWEIESRSFVEIKKKLLFQLAGFGQPVILVEDANYQNRGELLLRHRHEGLDLRKDYGREVMKNLFTLWRRPVHILTRTQDKQVLIGFDGKEHQERTAT
jgi:stage V sporulation protein R